jgi:thiosulfate/3-mercaptopyruvate sulfurtransferase
MVRSGALTALLSTLGLLMACTPSHPPAQSEGPAHPESLWSLARLDTASGDFLLVDVRPDSLYATGHLSGARQVWRDDLSLPADSVGAIEGMALSREAFRALLDSLGATATTHLVAYDGVGGCDAARFWWLCRLYGHERVALLDGFWTARTVHDSPAAPVAKGYQFPATGDASLLATQSDVARGNALLLDGRSTEEFDGSICKPGAARPGAIPGSLHWDWGMAVDFAGDGCIRPLGQLRDDFARLGITDTTHVITYCHSGVRSAHTTFVLRELLGYSNVSNYDGSWVEWSQTPL